MEEEIHLVFARRYLALMAIFAQLIAPSIWFFVKPGRTGTCWRRRGKKKREGRVISYI